MNSECSRILVIDDTPKNLDVFSELLEQQGCDVLFALDGENGIQCAESGQPDLILLDVMMPGMDGFETCQQLKANGKTKDIPVIFVTALSETVQKVKGFECGGVDYITKPIQTEEVLARVNAHLTIRKLQQELRRKNEQLQGKNAQLDEKNAQLMKLTASKDKFFSIIAHDLRAPFTGLMGLTEVLAEEFDAYSRDQLRGMLRRLHGSSERVYSLLENLLTWSRLQRGLIEHTPEEIFIDNLIERIIPLFASKAEQKQVLIRSMIPQKTVAYADLRMVNTVIRNLLSNALKFTDAHGIIEVSAKSGQESVEIAIADTGIGMSREYQEKLFRIDAKSSRQGTAGETGTGLGMILCKEFVDRNGGRIWVESEEGKGSTFRFTLPGLP